MAADDLQRLHEHHQNVEVILCNQKSHIYSIAFLLTLGTATFLKLLFTACFFPLKIFYYFPLLTP